MKEVNGYKYSKEKFEGYTNRAMFRLSVSEDWREDNVINIYTDCKDRIETSNTVKTLVTDKVLRVSMEHFTTKEQDELTSKFIEETLKDL